VVRFVFGSSLVSLRNNGYLLSSNPFYDLIKSENFLSLVETCLINTYCSLFLSFLLQIFKNKFVGKEETDAL
jgi:hypothetical protein